MVPPFACDVSCQQIAKQRTKGREDSIEGPHPSRLRWQGCGQTASNTVGEYFRALLSSLEEKATIWGMSLMLFYCRHTRMRPGPKHESEK